MRLFGLTLPPDRSSELWEDGRFAHSGAGDVGPLDLVLFNRSSDAWGAHMAVVVAGGPSICAQKSAVRSYGSGQVLPSEIDIGLSWELSVSTVSRWYSRTPVVTMTLNHWQASSRAAGNPDVYATVLAVSGTPDWNAAATYTDTLATIRHWIP